MRHPHVSIIVLNWNGLKDTLKCLESLQKISYPNYSIIVVDNHSSDSSVNVIRNKFAEVKLVKNKKNLGYAEGNNIGIKKALKSKTDYILLLNNDTHVKNNFLNELVRVSEQSNEIGIVGPKIYYSDKPKTLWFAGGKLKFFKGPFIHIGYNKIDSTEFSKIKNVDYITGCCILIKKTVFEKIGYLNKNYFMYVEDIDFNFRAKKNGFKIIFVPSALIWHEVSASTQGGVNPLKEYYKSRNALKFGKDNLMGVSKFLFILALLIDRCKTVIITRNYKITYAVVRGLYNGLKY